ncbi:MAG: DUF4215 domain-containing protein [Deltaproteobacteria bacterium]|nr:DUF4215 domain-containing protein [Deltaproteobacteria bacterium]
MTPARILSALGLLLLASSPPAHAATVCGNGTCERPSNATWETNARCAQDCFCGDGLCYLKDGETAHTCAADCSCGDGCCDRWEQLDGSCSADCQNPPAGPCGQGCRNAGEECDFAGFFTLNRQCGSETASGGWACRFLQALCGDGLLELGEQCDWGAANSDPDPDSCRTDCRFPYCGDHTQDSGEACDDGNSVDGDGCDANCTLSGCGNGVRSAGEECDDSNLTDGDGCDSNCTATRCGNGVVTVGESCDDGNAVDNDGCRNTCTPNVCGDGVQNVLLLNGQPAEACDDGNELDGDACSYDCRKDLARCNNQTLEPGEVCDFGILNEQMPNTACRKDCEARRCGDGVVDDQFGEACDRAAGCGPDCQPL